MTCHPFPQFRYGLCSDLLTSILTRSSVVSGRHHLADPCAVQVSFLLPARLFQGASLHVCFSLSCAESVELLQALKTVERSLGRPTAEVFASISPKPLAAASLGQVHLRRTPPAEQPRYSTICFCSLCAVRLC